jgi:hypothetical protein
VREERIREAVAWVRMKGLVGETVFPGTLQFCCPGTVQVLRDHFITQYYYTKETAAELTAAVLKRVRFEQTNAKLPLARPDL